LPHFEDPGKTSSQTSSGALGATSSTSSSSSHHSPSDCIQNHPTPPMATTRSKSSRSIHSRLSFSPIAVPRPSKDSRPNALNIFNIPDVGAAVPVDARHVSLPLSVRGGSSTSTNVPSTAVAGRRINATTNRTMFSSLTRGC
jgi:hypothetical protein